MNLFLSLLIISHISWHFILLFFWGFFCFQIHVQVSDRLTRGIILQNMSLGEERYVLTLGRVAWTWFSSWTCVCSIWPCLLMFEQWCHEMRGFLGLVASCYTTVYALDFWESLGGLDEPYYTYSPHGQNYCLPDIHDYKCEPQTCHNTGFKSEMSYTKFVIRVETVLPTLGGWLLNLRMQIWIHGLIATAYRRQGTEGSEQKIQICSNGSGTCPVITPLFLHTEASRCKCTHLFES